MMSEVYACGNCGGALDVREGVSIVECPYCGFKNEVSKLKVDLEAFKQEMQSWLTNLGVTGQASVDVGLRRLYFTNEIYPDLVTQLANIVSQTDDILDYPLVYLRMYQKFPDLGLRRQWSASIGKPMKDYARRLGSPDLLAFAPDAESKKKIMDLRLQALMIPTLMDIVSLSSDPSPDNLRRSANSLDTIIQEIDKVLSTISGDSSLQAYENYYTIMKRRFEIAAATYQKITEAVSDRHDLDDSWVQEQIKTLHRLRSDLDLIQGISVVEKVPLDFGIDNDISSLMTWDGIIATYIALTNRPLIDFIAALEQFTDATFFYAQPAKKGIDQSWFFDFVDSKKYAWFIDGLRATVRSGELKIIDPQRKADSAPYLYPLYLLRVEAILRSGSLWWKKGETEDFHVLVDGAFQLFPGFYKGDYPMLMTPVGKKIVGKSLDSKLEAVAKISARTVPKSAEILPPTVAPQDVIGLFTYAHNFREEAEFARAEGRMIEVPSSYKKRGFDPGRVKAVNPEVVGLYYAPLISVKGRYVLALDGLELETYLPHRGQLALRYSEFLKQIQ
ncbi:MAG: hypothetical protein K9W43_14200 [Candidatus Thorarchaeota archaeon]|nr:hypothetical protein [Candidatus Thorarchaeota archaeon]